LGYQDKIFIPTKGSGALEGGGIGRILSIAPKSINSATVNGNRHNPHKDDDSKCHDDDGLSCFIIVAVFH
jgi:hypothetical protein